MAVDKKRLVLYGLFGVGVYMLYNVFVRKPKLLATAERIEKSLPALPAPMRLANQAMAAQLRKKANSLFGLDSGCGEYGELCPPPPQMGCMSCASREA